MREHGYNVGGEPSGHIILSDYTTTGDGFVAALQVLAVVKKQNKPVSEVCHRFDAAAAGAQECALSQRQAAGKLQGAFGDRGRRKRLNGHGRLVVRPSGTEPVIRVMGEGDDKALVEEIVDGIVDALTDSRGVIRLAGSAPRDLQEVRERLQRRFRDVMLDALGVGLGRFGRHAERAQHIDHEPVADAHAIGQRMALLGQKHAAIGPRGRQARRASGARSS